MADAEVRFTANTTDVDAFISQLQSHPVAVPVTLTPSGTPTIPSTPGAFAAGVPSPGAALTTPPGGGASSLSQAITAQAALAATSPADYAVRGAYARGPRPYYPPDYPTAAAPDDEEDSPGIAGGRGRGGGRFGRGYGGLLAIHFATHIAAGVARYSLRDQEVQSQLARGTDPQLDRLRAELEGIQGQESIPYFGYGIQIGEAITGRLDPRGYSKLNLQNRIQDIGRERERAQFDTGLGAERLESRTTAAGLRRGAWLEGLTGTARDVGAANVALAEQQDRAYGQRAALVAAVNTAPSGKAFGEAQDRLQEFDRNRAPVAAAEIVARDARLNVARREDRLGGLLASNQFDALSLGAAGRFGAARDAAFEAGLKAAEIQATISPQYSGQLSDVQSLNALRRKQDEARTAYEGRQVSYDSAATQAELRHDTRGAIDARYAGRAADILANADPANVAALTKQANRERLLAHQSFGEQTLGQLYGLNVANAALESFIRGPGTRGERSTVSEGIDIYGQTLEAARNALLADRGGNVGAIQRHGQLQLEQLQTAALAGFRAQEVHLGQVAVQSPESGLAKIQELLEKLGSMPDKLDTINKTLADFDKVQ
jgi:hypothetical protein